jgi:Concanavalin A-like lectin/glucanases superfamily
MRRHVIAVATVAGLAAGLAIGPTAHGAVSPNLVLFYKFDAHQGASVTDSSNSHLNGTLVNANPSTAYVTGRAGYKKALGLAAQQRQFVDVPQGPTLDVNKFTLAALVKYTGTQTAETLDRWEVLEKAGAYWLNIRTDGHVRAGGFFGGCANNRYWKYFDSAATVPTNTWTHVASTYNGSKLTIYINGVASGSMNVTGATCANDEPLAVGAKNAPAKGLLEAFWDGQLDDVRVYNKALTAVQIAKLAS